MSTPAAPSEIKTPNEGAIYWRRFIGVETLPANSREKKPSSFWKRYQDPATPATDEEFQNWLDNDKFGDGVCILTGRVRHRPDRRNLFYVKIDGDRAAGIKELLTRNGRTITIQDVAKKWIVEQHKDNPEKGHFGFYSPIRFPEKSPDPIIGIEVRCEDTEGKTGRVVMVSPSIHQDGHPYEIIGTKDPEVLTELQAHELMQHINQICIRNGVEYLTKTGNSRLDGKLKKMIQKMTIDTSIEITEGQRNDILIAVADSILFNHSHKFSEDRLRKYFDDTNEQICKPPLDDKEVEQLWERAYDFVEAIKEKEKSTNGNGNSYGNNSSNGSSNNNSESAQTQYGSEQEDVELPTCPALYGLDKDVYGIMNFKPTVLAVARSKTKQIVKAKVVKNEYKDASGQIQKNLSLDWIQAIIDAIPIKVVKNNNPLDKKGKPSFTITFAHTGSKKPFTIGPATISKIIEDLTDRGHVLKRLNAADALTSLLAAYDKTGKVVIDDQIPTPGYYWQDGKIVGYHITQRLDFDPWNNEQHRNEALECINTFHEWQNRNKKKTALPSALKWCTLAPFSFITKTQSKGVDKWLPSFYPYQTTDAGKTTLIRDAILATWGIYHDSENSKIHFKGPGSLDSPFKFGNAMSQTTLPILGDEIAKMFNDSDNKYSNNMLEMQKFAVQNEVVRTVFGEDVLALASFAFTSNDPPPNDAAARRRFFAIEFTDDEVWTEDEKKDYEAWMNDVIDPITNKSRRERLSVYGDFVASYVIRYPELIIGYSSFSWHEPSTEILKEFYRSVNIEPPSWLDLLAEQTIVQEAKEERQFELRGFLQQQINEGYRRDIYANPTPDMIIETDNGAVRNIKPVTFEQKTDYCLNNRSIPFLHKCNRSLNLETDVAITSNIISELKKHNRSAASTTMKTLAAKIPGFDYSQRWIGSDKIWVICGPISKFKEYVDYKIVENS
jgi:hypothetical protein